MQCAQAAPHGGHTWPTHVRGTFTGVRGTRRDAHVFTCKTPSVSRRQDFRRRDPPGLSVEGQNYNLTNAFEV